MDRSAARRVLAAALALGVLADILFDGPAFGINVPLAVVALLGAGWLVRRRGTAPDPLDAWLPVAALACAGFVALTGDPFLTLVDTAGALGFTGAAIVAMAGVPVTRRSAEIVAALAAYALAAVLGGSPAALRAARPLEGAPRRLPPSALPVVRGLLLGVPVALIFAVLFASADPIFRRTMDDLLGFNLDLGDLPGRVVFTLACAWLAGGLLSVAANGVPQLAGASLGAAAGWQTAGRSRRLGMPEALIVLVLVDLVSGAFVALQVAYLFGGIDTLAAAGMTYSDYARRGFFELVAAACLAGGLLVVLEIATTGRTRAYLAAALVLVGLTLVVLVSAWLRLDLYQQAYGWTELRFYVAAAIVTLGVALGFGGLLLVRDRMRWLGHGLVVLGLMSLLSLNALAPAAFVAERNVERALDPSLVPADGWVGLDTGYLGALGDDAVPVLVDALPRLAEPLRAEVLAQLRDRQRELMTDPALTAPAAWNLSRERAKAALATLP
jgi:hypothetical protein